MARIGITQQQVFDTAEQLIQEGIKPTVKEVRERLGSGSFSTISTFLAAWRDESTAQTVADIPEMPEKLKNAFAQVWATAAKAAQDDLDTQKQALEAMKREFRQEQEDMSEEIKRLEQALEEQRQQHQLMVTDGNASLNCRQTWGSFRVGVKSNDPLLSFTQWSKLSGFQIQLK